MNFQPLSFLQVMPFHRTFAFYRKSSSMPRKEGGKSWRQSKSPADCKPFYWLYSICAQLRLYWDSVALHDNWRRRWLLTQQYIEQIFSTVYCIICYCKLLHYSMTAVYKIILTSFWSHFIVDFPVWLPWLTSLYCLFPASFMSIIAFAVRIVQWKEKIPHCDQDQGIQCHLHTKQALGRLAWQNSHWHQ